MTTPKRPRGRPVGSGKNDDPTLTKVARILVQNPMLKPTTAMNRVINARKDWPETDATLRRRLQEKWRVSGEALLDRARQELAPKAPTLAEILARIDKALSGFKRFMVSPEVMQALGNLDSRISKLANTSEMARALEAFSAWDRKWKEVASSSPWFDMNKLGALEQSMKRFAAPTLTLAIQDQFPQLDDATRRYLSTGLLSAPSRKADE